MRNVGKKTVVMFSEFKERQIVKLIFSVVFFVVLLGMMDNVQADEVSTFEDLKEKLTVSESSEVTIVLNNENDIIQLEEEINVDNNITKLTIYMNDNTIDGNGNPFLNFEGTCELAIKNTQDDYDPSHYLDSEGNLIFDQNAMGTINLSSRGYRYLHLYLRE